MLWIQDFLNQIQSSLSHPDVKDTWFDELYFEDKSPNNNIRNQKILNKKEYLENTPRKISSTIYGIIRRSTS